jgi:hypothetical protein
VFRIIDPTIKQGQEALSTKKRLRIEILVIWELFDLKHISMHNGSSGGRL